MEYGINIPDKKKNTQIGVAPCSENKIAEAAGNVLPEAADNKKLKALRLVSADDKKAA